MGNYNPFSLEGKTILVTGASSGIGRAIAIECSKMGATMIITARNEIRLQETIAMMEGEGHRYICADLSEDSAIDNIVVSIEGKLQGVVQCAGYILTKPFQFLSKDDINGVMRVNFESPVILTQALQNKKKLEKGCSIVFVSSIAGVYISNMANSIYAASKGALNGIIKGIAIEFATKGIRVNSINPGMINTDIFGGGAISEDQFKEDAKKYPLKRYGKPEEVAYGVIYLLSDASSWTTGSNLLVDGGFLLQ